MACVAPMMDGIWFDGPRVLQEEYNYQVYLAQQSSNKSALQCPKSETTPSSCVAQQIAQARERIHQTLQGTDTAVSVDASAKLQSYESENAELRKLVDSLIHRMSALEARLGKLEAKESKSESAEVSPVQEKPTPAKEASDDEDDDDDVDLFGSDESEDEETKKIVEERLAAYHAKKSKKPAVIAKSNIIIDVKPWDDTTDMAELEKEVRSIQTDGLIWGPSKLMEVAYGIMKLQISCVVEDDKVGTDFLEEKITEFEDLVQSMDVVAFNKV